MRYILLILIAVLFSACTRPSLKVHTNSPKNGLAILYNTETEEIDTVSFNRGEFEFNIQADHPTMFRLYFDRFDLQFEPCWILLSKNFTRIKFDSIVNLKDHNIMFPLPNRPHFINDPNSNISFYRFHDLLKSFSDSILLLSSNDSVRKMYTNTRKRLYENFIMSCDTILSANKSKAISSFIINYLINNSLLTPDKIQEYYSELDPNIKQNYLGQMIASELNTLVGKKAPRFRFVGLDGKEYNSGDFKNTNILLHFWSTSCGPCLMEMPQLLKFQESHVNITILNISMDVDSLKWASSVINLGLNNMINFCDFRSIKGQIVKDFNVSEIPKYYLIDKNGILIARGRSIFQIEMYLNK